MIVSYIDDYDFQQTYILICDNGDILIRCSKKELEGLLLDLYKDKDVKILEFFVYKSEEYFMYREGDNYNVNKNYNEISR
tara:strand:+ start:1924 stop:2163 length:240 start_codon:yes stop_codon:yes gene_type:complete